MERLLALLARQNVSAVYCEETLATRTDRVGVHSVPFLVAMTSYGDDSSVNLKTRRQRLEHLLVRNGYAKKYARQLVERFRRHVPFRRLTDDYFLPGGVVVTATIDLNDSAFVHEAIRQAIAETVGAPSPFGEFKFEIISASSAFHVLTDLDFDRINENRAKQIPPVSEISPAHLLNEILMARACTRLYQPIMAAKFGRLHFPRELCGSGITNS